MKEDVSFISRQCGAGTRILLDKDKLDMRLWKGSYNATAVKSWSADVVLGIKVAEQVMDLDFVPIISENYDFLVR
ncbi:substrate-binding domain-containing protein [uncultured Ilyobacter sp.]|uniref:substrate-binding domain-containing protein n=1 Tax=uncultured Ilyobacter sp. TaxID=544433 RepID=UPI00374860D8